MESHGITFSVAYLVLQLGVILFIATFCGEICERWLKQPPVLGELIGGMLIGPYALGSKIIIPIWGIPLFDAPGSNNLFHIPLSLELYSIAQIGIVILLFMIGLETHMGQFLKQLGRGTVIAVGGVCVPFLFGDYATIFFGLADSFIHPLALFMGAIMTATSVGITARVLSDIKKLHTSEGITTLGAAVIDDILGILILTIVVSISINDHISYTQLGIVTVKAIGFGVGLTVVGVCCAKYISNLLLKFKSEGAMTALAIGLLFLCSVLAEIFGLAMIIGAYIIGLSLSQTELATRLKSRLLGIYNILVPIFFVVMGMLVDLSAIGNCLIFGLIITFLALISKVIGCGLPAMFVGFNPLGALRIGIGMLPRGEVALIIAGIGLTSGVIKSDIFGVCIMMTIVTTFLATILLVPAFKYDGRGRGRLEFEAFDVDS